MVDIDILEYLSGKKEFEDLHKNMKIYLRVEIFKKLNCPEVLSAFEKVLAAGNFIHINNGKGIYENEKFWKSSGIKYYFENIHNPDFINNLNHILMSVFLTDSISIPYNNNLYDLLKRYSHLQIKTIANMCDAGPKIKRFIGMMSILHDVEGFVDYEFITDEIFKKVAAEPLSADYLLQLINNAKKITLYEDLKTKYDDLLAKQKASEVNQNKKFLAEIREMAMLRKIKRLENELFKVDESEYTDKELIRLVESDRNHFLKVRKMYQNDVDDLNKEMLENKEKVGILTNTITNLQQELDEYKTKFQRLNDVINAAAGSPA